MKNQENSEKPAEEKNQAAAEKETSSTREEKKDDNGCHQTAYDENEKEKEIERTATDSFTRKLHRKSKLLTNV